MYAGPGLPKSLSDMELNLIDEAAKQSGEGETASSLGDTGIDAQHLRSGLPARDDWAEAGPSQPVSRAGDVGREHPALHTPCFPSLLPCSGSSTLPAHSRSLKGDSGDYFAGAHAPAGTPRVLPGQTLT